MIELAYQLYPIHRSITGKGVVKTLKIIKRKINNLKIKSFISGSKVFDWKIPPEWNIKDAYISNLNDKKIIDFKKNNLHIVNYSIPIDKIIKKEKLFNHIHTLPKQVDTIPYVTSYYKKYWGFCMKESEKNYKIKSLK